jgi:uncharacterized coiled-coil DUF342 family protein
MLGNAGQKITRIVDLAEELYERVVELREQVSELRETTQDTHDRVAGLENEVAAQRALLEALAETEGLDVDELRSDAGETASEDPDEPTEAASGQKR